MVLFVYQSYCLCVLIMMISRLFFDKIPLVLDVQRVWQLNTLLVVILHFGKGTMFWFSYLLLGFDGLGLFLVSIGLDLDYAHVEMDFGETTKMVFDWDLYSFRGRWSYPSKQGPLSHLIFRKLMIL